MEAALRTAVEELTGEELEKVEFVEVRGTEGIKEAVYHVAGMDVKVAVASGLSNAKIIMDKIRAGEADYHFVEIMCCPGGCVNGGGQPQYMQMSAILRMYVRSARKCCMTMIRQRHCGNLMRILRSRECMKNIWEHQEARKHITFCILPM